MERKIEGIFSSNHHHQVGEAFKVINIFPNGNDFGDKISPFYMIDYNPEIYISPTDKPLGVDQHPHRGMEPVTLLYQGALSHTDSAGYSGTMKAGDVQWMTAGKGILHKEFIDPEMLKTGGNLEMVQLWVVLPKKFKYVDPGYQHLDSHHIKTVKLDDNKGEVRIIAGGYNSVKSDTSTFSPLNLLDVHLTPGAEFTVDIPERDNAGILFMKGKAVVNNEDISGVQFVLFKNEGKAVKVKSVSDIHFLLLNGEPLNEPAVHKGPFVMNTQEEIDQAYADVRSGWFGRIES